MNPPPKPLNLKRWLLPLLLAVVVAITIVTGLGLKGSASFSGSSYGLLFLILLYVNLLLVLVLGFLVIRNLFRLWMDRRRRRTGSQLRTRMAWMFIALSLLPTIVIAILSVNFLNRGVDSWFSDQVANALENSLGVARAYYRENQRTVRHDAEAMVRNRNVTTALTLQGGEAAAAILEVERTARGLDEIAIFRGNGTRIANAGDLPRDPLPDFSVLDEGSTRALMITNDSGERVRAFMRLGDDLYLSAGHWIDRQILGQMETIESVYVNYHQLRASHGLLKANHTVTLVLIALLLLLTAIWSGFRIADDITDPITDLVIGTRKVANGDLTATLPVIGDDELSTLMASFNAMTRKLAENRTELQSTNALLEEHGRFMAAIVGNISAGVISVNRFDRVTLINPAAGALLGIDDLRSLDQPFAQVIPGEVLHPLRALIQNPALRGRAGAVRGVEAPALPIQIQTQGPEKPRILLARITPLEDSQGNSEGFIATFDDLTDVVIAQRTHAWTEVARRIAHEIKNPLTPIQLWTQRLRRKYLRQGESERRDLRVLDEATDTIIKQVEELRVLVNEFSTFSRLPRPNLREDDMVVTFREALRLHDAELKSVDVLTDFPRTPVLVAHDRSQIKQAVINLIANALAAMQEHDAPSRLAISIRVDDNGEWLVMRIADSGPGIPPADRDRVFEPYFTTKKKGTGLGMAIVKKIIEDHGGTIQLRASEWQGVEVEVRLPRAIRNIPAVLSPPAHLETDGRTA